jgi:very-short-patch-repair endonuclease
MATDGSGSDLDDTKTEETSPEGEQNSRQVRSTVGGQGRSVLTPGQLSLVPAPPPAGNTASSLLGRQIQTWADRLIDRTKNNRLLYFDPTKPNAQEVASPAPTLLWDRTVTNEQKLQIWLPQAPHGSASGRGRGSSGSPEEENDQENRQIESLMPLSDLRDKCLLLSGRTVRKTRDFATRIFRKASEEMVERGLQVAFLAFGLVHWRDDGQDDEGAAPLILVPVEIKRENPSAPFVVAKTDEEPLLNPVLRAHMSRLFGVDLADFDLPPDEDVHWADVLAAYSRDLRKPGLRCQDGCWLGYFTFHKLVMFKDLERHAAKATDSSLLQDLSGVVERLGDGPPVVHPEEVDGLFQPSESFQVRDADSSQQACIEMAKRGDNMVIIGPPGTGKSQTIANIIAELLGLGRSVLFVAEKMAALEVVQRRLAEDGLGDFCLELHSHKAQKRTVIDELARTLAAATAPEVAAPEAELARWTSLRAELNGYAQALHEKREPLGQCAFVVLGRLSGLHDAPLVPAQIERPDLLTPARLATYQELARQLSELHAELTAGVEHPWNGFNLPLPGLAQLDVLRGETRQMSAQAEALRRGLDLLLNSLGLRPGDDPDWSWLGKLVEVVSKCPGCDPKWLLEGDPVALLREARELGDRVAQFAEAQRILAQSWHEGILKADWNWLQRWNSAQARLSELGGEPPARELLDTWNHLGRVAMEGSTALDELDRAYTATRAVLGLDELPPLPEPGVAENLVAVLEALLGVDRVEALWVSREGWEQADQCWKEARQRLLTWHQTWADLAERWSKDILEVDLASAHAGFSGAYRSVLRWLRPAFWRDKKLLIRLSRNAKLPETVTDDLRAARDLQAQRVTVADDTPRFARALGSRFVGLATDVALLDRALERGRGLRALPLEYDWAAVAHRAEAKKGEIRIEGTLARLKAALEETSLLCKTLSGIWETPPSGLVTAQGTRDLVTGIRRFVDEIAPLRLGVVGLWRGQQDVRLANIVRAFELRGGIETTLSMFAQKQEHLRLTFGPEFTAPPGQWAPLVTQLGWCVELKSLFSSTPIPASVVERAAAPGRTNHTAEMEHIQALRQEVCAWLERNFESASIRRHSRDDLTLGCSDMLSWTRKLADNVDAVSGWCRFRDLLPELRRVGLGSWLEGVWISRVPRAEIWRTLERSLYTAWYDEIARQDGRLGKFEQGRHSDRIAAFRTIDRSLREWARQSLRGQLGARRPGRVAFAPGGQLGLLKKEANKKRRQMPLPKLFAQAPEVIGRLKPCMLMSPISVAQFLAPHAWQFDTVIFDEASQLCVEDAVGCLMRAKQAIVVGDPKQLAPTSFFKAADDDDLYDEDAELDDGDYTSLIDAGLAHWRELCLRWHYRSHHHSLIAFSNDAFYNNELTIFPSSKPRGDDLGVTFLHVADGQYDRGKSATNRREAESVVEQVFDHVRRNGRQRSLGVIAFSLRQAHLIEDLINERRRLGSEPELEPCFEQEGAEPFFVKNLENVQGDERDVIFISVGYGKDADGKLSYNFGPVNQRGGPNRLNVAVTRAKQRVVVVASIRAADFDPSKLNTDGVRLLRNYLAFAETGPESLKEATGPSVGDYESEFERSVAGAIRELGYRPVPQVGCGRFRIDLGVLASTGDGQYLLGVECDGAQYHSSPTARDRDRLRDQILEEQYGWRLFRIWGPDWVRSRAAVIQRLRAALDEARKRPPLPNTTAARRASPPPHPVVIAPRVARPKQAGVEHGEDSERFGFRYQTLAIVARDRPFDFHAPEALDDHVGLLRRIVEAEGPIHFELGLARIRDAWRLKRAGNRMSITLDQALVRLVTGGEVEVRRDGDDRYLWPLWRIPQLPRWPDDEGERRPLEWIAPEELVAAAIHVVRETCGLSEEELMRAVAKYFGWQQLTDIMRPRLVTMVERAISDGQICRRGDDLVMP